MCSCTRALSKRSCSVGPKLQTPSPRFEIPNPAVWGVLFPALSVGVSAFSLPAFLSGAVQGTDNAEELKTSTNSTSNTELARLLYWLMVRVLPMGLRWGFAAAPLRWGVAPPPKTRSSDNWWDVLILIGNPKGELDSASTAPEA